LEYLTRFPLPAKTGILFLIFGIISLVTARTENARNKLVYLYFIVFFTLFFFIYIAARYASFVYTSHVAPIVIILIISAFFFAVLNRTGTWRVAGALGVGAMIAVGWMLTDAISSQSFNPTGIKSVSFIGPSADTLMGFINNPSLPLVFDLGLVPGVFAGSFIAALFAGELKLQCFSLEESPMPRYVLGAMLMGFGGMLAGGCAVGAGMTGGSIFSLTAWVALSAMWAGAAVTDYIVDRYREALAGPEAASVPLEDEAVRQS